MSAPGDLDLSAAPGAWTPAMRTLDAGVATVHPSRCPPGQCCARVPLANGPQHA